MSFLKFDNVTGTTADIKLSDVVRFAIRNGYIDLGASASADAPDTAIATREDIKFSGGHMFQIIEHNGPLETIPLGTIPANGQKVYEYLYPQQYAKIIAGHQFAVTEVLWNSGVSGNVDAYKGCWSLGGEDEYGKWVRAPKLNADTNYRAPFLRGSKVGVDAGKITDDVFRSHTHGVIDPGHVHSYGRSTGTSGSGGLLDSLTASSSGVPFVDASYTGISISQTGGTETSPRYHGVIMCIRMFGTVSNPGALDAAQLATDLSVANAKIATLQAIPVIQSSPFKTSTKQLNIIYTNNTNRIQRFYLRGNASVVEAYLCVYIGTVETFTDGRWLISPFVPSTGWGVSLFFEVLPGELFRAESINVTLSEFKESV